MQNKIAASYITIKCCQNRAYNIFYFAISAIASLDARKYRFLVLYFVCAVTGIMCGDRYNDAIYLPLGWILV